MAGVHGLKNRIKSLESTKQMTKSMKTVSATRLRKNQMAFMRLRPYAEKSREMERMYLQSVRPWRIMMY